MCDKMKVLTCIEVILVVNLLFICVKAITTNVNMCERNIMIRELINLYHNINDLDLQLTEVTCQCDLYTPPYRGCVRLKALRTETLDLLQECKIQGNETFNIYNSSCSIQYKVNELYDNCTHNITVLIVPNHFLLEPVKEWLEISASDSSGVYINCKWTGTLTTEDTLTSETDTTSEPLTLETTQADVQTNRSHCENCSRPSGGNVRNILPSEVADQIEIIFATGCGFVLAFLVVSLVCVCISAFRKQDKMEITRVNNEQTVAQSSVTTDVQVNVTVNDDVFVDACSAEVKHEDSGSYNEPTEKDIDDESTNKYFQLERRPSDGGYDNVAFE